MYPNIRKLYHLCSSNSCRKVYIYIYKVYSKPRWTIFQKKYCSTNLFWEGKFMKPSPLSYKSFGPLDSKRVGGLFSWELFPCTCMMPLHIWRSNVQIIFSLAHMTFNLILRKSYLCGELITSADANVHLNALSFCYILALTH